MAKLAWDWPGAVVTRVIDGDSFLARVRRDLGFHGTATFEQRMRLNRINARPKGTTDGDLATRLVEQLTAGLMVDILTTGAYKYGDEWMAEVTLPDGRNLSDELVTEGLAVYWDGTGPRPGG